MTNYGVVGFDARDGDGAGTIASIPQKIILEESERDQSFKLPALGQYATSNLFFKLDSTIPRGDKNHSRLISDTSNSVEHVRWVSILPERAQTLITSSVERLLPTRISDSCLVERRVTALGHWDNGAPGLQNVLLAASPTQRPKQVCIRYLRNGDEIATSSHNVECEPHGQLPSHIRL
jgi:hypothetical protein